MEARADVYTTARLRTHIRKYPFQLQLQLELGLFVSYVAYWGLFTVELVVISTGM